MKTINVFVVGQKYFKITSELLRSGIMVVRLALNQEIGVRFPGPQLANKKL